METNELTILDVEEDLIQRLAEATDPKDIEALSSALAKVHNSIAQQEKGIDELRLTSEIEEKKLVREKKGNFWRILGGIGTALLTAGGVIGSQYVKGVMDSKYQDEGYEHEKTEAVIWNRNKHRR
jgi:hypothetical protein